ncbi:hypothetical protein GCM10027285_26760 [Oleiagrimonas citrea]|uniref:Flagella basal body P-ring formation protein FlgA n=1 Tax=Oleiagrimonas citrea TaxID=1665687 RepID=A0A846ZM21_9GAMM|nr:flagellar basal body P-ring formation chaperone FlgA [Oleiagrimonas citrea]NKZ39016.1 flagellar basal body P-ring formation protein FlgA [Oleiagrimonas citrea]
MLTNLLAMLMLATSVHASAPNGAHYQTVPTARLVRSARAVLPAKPVSTHASVIGAPKALRVPRGKVSLRAVRPSGHWPRARVAVPVRVLVDGVARGQATIWFAVRAPASGWVFRGDMPADAKVDASDVVTGDFDRARIHSVPVQNMSRLSDMRLKHAVMAGMPVVQGDFEAVPMVDAQSRVEVHLAMGNIRMEVKGQALASGGHGDVIPVLVHGASAPVRARVQSQGVVQVVQ